MIILRQKNYSSSKEKEDEEKNKKSKRRGRLATAGAIGAIVGGEALGTKYALKEGVLDNIDEDMADELRKRLKIKKREQTPEDSKLFRKLAKKAKNKGIKTSDYSPVGPAYDPKTDTVMGLGSKKGADLLSHELGHRHYFKDKDAGKVSKAAHKIYEKTGGSLVNGYIAPAATGVTAGIITGKRKARKEDKGEKESIVNKHASWVAPIIASSPMLISEAAASRHGIKSLKEAGASKEYIKGARKSLGTAFGIYATKALAGAGIGAATKHAAYRKEKRKLKKKNLKKIRTN